MVDTEIILISLFMAEFFLFNAKLSNCRDFVCNSNEDMSQNLLHGGLVFDNDIIHGFDKCNLRNDDQENFLS